MEMAGTDDAHTPAPANAPEDLGRFLVERLNAGDLEGLVALYEPDAVLALPGKVATGAEQIREAFAGFIGGGPFTAGEQRPPLVSGDLALTSTRLPNGDITTEVARRQPDGSWRWVIDEPKIN